MSNVKELSGMEFGKAEPAIGAPLRGSARELSFTKTSRMELQ
jgi:hypothetical protein